VHPPRPLVCAVALGVWDTVGALGWPSLSGKPNRKYRFHDISLTPFVDYARHAVATDERRALFPPELWGDLTEMNRARKHEPGDDDALTRKDGFRARTDRLAAEVIYADYQTDHSRGSRRAQSWQASLLIERRVPASTASIPSPWRPWTTRPSHLALI
jgi:uncharacterized protein (DUF2235 family)